MIQAKLWEAPVKSPTIHFRKCFKMWHDHSDHLAFLIGSRKIEQALLIDFRKTEHYVEQQ
jgi:hypothetical protein